MNRPNIFVTTLLAVSFSLSAFADDVEITSSYVKNPSFESDFTSWTNSGMQIQSNNSFKQKKGSNYAEKWTSKGSKIGSTSVTQTISKLPAGHYKLTAGAQNIQEDNNTAQTGAVIYAGTKTTTVTSVGLYEVEFDGTGADIKIGFRCTNATGNWVATDNFKLYFTGGDAETLAANIIQAEAYLVQEMEASFKSKLQSATGAAKALADDATEADIDAAAASMVQAMGGVAGSIADIKSLKTAITAAQKVVDQTMAPGVKATLTEAISAAQSIVDGTTADGAATATATLTEATSAARNSHSAYVKLESALNTAHNVYDAAKNGASELQAAITAAQATLDGETSVDADYTNAVAELNTAVLAFRVANATGTTPKVTTGAVIQGATMLFARGKFPSSGTRETGFCYSTTNPEPTVTDGRSTQKYSNNGNIYCMSDLTPASVYYVRAYAIGTGYSVGYGDVVKTYTRPMGSATYDYDYAGDDATDARIVAACEEGVWMWNNVTGLPTFNLSAHYVPGAGAGTGTADCSYGGYMRISQATSYQRTGTILHEGAHGQGMVPYTDWTNSLYRANGDRGDWLGPRVDRVIQFLENSATAKLHGDNQHMWPYGINGAQEDTGSKMLYYANALLVGALAEDGIITPNQSFMKAAYSFASDDTTKYYIKNASENRGLTTAYLREVEGANRPQWKEMTAIDAISNDSCAWYVTFSPATCTYTIRNAATDKALTTTFTLSSTASGRMQLMTARASTKSNGHTFASLAYWIVNPSRNAFVANANGATASTAFNHADGAQAQRWLFLDRSEVAAFGIATGDDSANGVRALHQVAESQLAVASGEGCIYISAHGQRVGQAVSVYTIDGRLVERVFVQGGATATVRLPRGMYVVGRQKVCAR